MRRGRPKTFDRDSALMCALDVFWRDGYDGASLAHLVDAMGIGRQSLYDTFGDKHQLFLEALNRYVERRDEGLTAYLEATDQPPLERIRRLLGRILERAHSDDRGCLVTSAVGEFGASDPVVHTRLVEARRDLEDRLVAVLDEALAEGALGDEVDTTAWARAIIVQIHGAMLLARDPTARPLIDDSMRTFWATLAPGTPL